MSLVMEAFRNVDGETAYLGGAISTMADRINVDLFEKINMKYVAFDADIFSMDYNLEESIKMRLKNYYLNERNISETDIDKLLNDTKFQLKLNDKYKNIADAFLSSLLGYVEDQSKIPYLKKMGEDFERDILYYLKKDNLKVYDVKCNTEVLNDCYTYILFNCIAVMMSDYCILMFFGSNE